MNSEDLCRQYDVTRKKIFSTIDEGRIRASAGRGNLRQKLDISAKLRAANNRGHKVETTLQRTLVRLLQCDSTADWYNEFALSAGVFGGNRSAVDLIRVSKRKKLWDFIELKEWNAKDTLVETATQVFRYGCTLSLLLEKKRCVPPYQTCDEFSLRLWVMAPEAYLASLGGVAEACRVFGEFRTFVSEVRASREMMPTEFMAVPLVLGDSIDKHDFISYLNDPPKEKLIQEWALRAVAPTQQNGC